MLRREAATRCRSARLSSPFASATRVWSCASTTTSEWLSFGFSFKSAYSIKSRRQQEREEAYEKELSEEQLIGEDGVEDAAQDIDPQERVMKGKIRNRYAVFGLGNPGKQYEMTRHNIGFRAIDVLLRRWNAGALTDAKCNALATMVQVKVDGNKVTPVINARDDSSASDDASQKTVLLAKPMTFMNLSGRAVRGLGDMHKIGTKNIFVIYDDVNLPLGSIRLRNKTHTGGGQKGILSVTKHMGSDARFVRVRVGVGKANGERPADLQSFVLKQFPIEEAKQVDVALQRVADCVEALLSSPLDRVMSDYSRDAEGLAETVENLKNKQKAQQQVALEDATADDSALATTAEETDEEARARLKREAQIRQDEIDARRAIKKSLALERKARDKARTRELRSVRKSLEHQERQEARYDKNHPDER